jgi:hypothetical protein
LNHGRNNIEKQPVQRRLEAKNKGPNAKLSLEVTDEGPAGTKVHCISKKDCLTRISRKTVEQSG